MSWESLVERHASEVLSENGTEDEIDVEGIRRRSGKPKKVSLTDPDATMATTGRKHWAEPSYKQHTAVDDLKGVILDVAVTTGEPDSVAEVVAGCAGKVRSILSRRCSTLLIPKWGAMKLLLHYRGPLMSNGSPTHKHSIRRVFHEQLRTPCGDSARWSKGKDY